MNITTNIVSENLSFIDRVGLIFEFAILTLNNTLSIRFYKPFKTTLILIFGPILLISQELVELDIVHQGLQRTCFVYVPASYNADQAAPLIINFHGYGSNARDQLAYGDFRPIADTAGFLIVVPQGTLLENTTHFNVGGWTNASTVDDIDFTRTFLDRIIEDYNIDTDRIYSTGMSNGGYMSFQLACQLSDRIAAIASVTGSMTTEIYRDCSPGRPVPILQMHGTSDYVVPYEGNNWSKSIDAVMEYWIKHNICDVEPEVVKLDNISSNDASTVEKYIYENGAEDVSIQHYKIINGGHNWSGTVFATTGTNQDIDASLEIWNFFKRYDMNGLVGITSSTDDRLPSDLTVNIYPNPTSRKLTIDNSDHKALQVEVYRMDGTLMQEVNTKRTIDLFLPKGLFFVKVNDGVRKAVKKIVVE